MISLLELLPQTNPNKYKGLMQAGASTVTHTQTSAGAVGSVTAICLTEGAPPPHPARRAALTHVEPEDLASFEGEGGLEAPEPASLHPQ